MAVASITIDDDEWCEGLLPYVERSFAITLPRDMRHIKTAGDLFDQITALREPAGMGERCDTSMVFYRLRRYLARRNPGQPVVSRTQLASVTTLSPKALSKRLARETGLEMPLVEFSFLGCLAWVVTPVAALAAWYFFNARVFALTAVIGALPIFFDRGGFHGAWKDVGSLAHAIASRNIAKLASLGARDRSEDWWRRLQEMLADASEPPKDEIRPLTAKRITRDTRIQLL